MTKYTSLLSAKKTAFDIQEKYFREKGSFNAKSIHPYTKYEVLADIK